MFSATRTSRIFLVYRPASPFAHTSGPGHRAASDRALLGSRRGDGGADADRGGAQAHTAGTGLDLVLPPRTRPRRPPLPRADDCCIKLTFS